jgi:hypothetical protein
MSEVYFTNISKIIDKNLKQAKFEIKIAVAWITDTNLLNTLSNCLSNGVKVYIVFYESKNNNVEAFEGIFELGANIRYSKTLMHNKFCVIDEVVTINGSYNWTFSAKTNNENIQVTKSYEVSSKFLREFEKIYSNSVLIDRYFSDKKTLFEQYLYKIEMPISYPVFYKQNLDNGFTQLLFNTSNHKIKYIYRLFTDESEFIDYQKIIYDFLFTNKRNYSTNHLLKHNFLSKTKNSSRIESWNKIYGGKFIVIDIIKSNHLNNLSSTYILNDEEKLINDKFYYFNLSSSSEKFLLVCIDSMFRDFEIEKIGLKAVLNLGVLKILENSIVDIVQFQFGNLTVENNYIVNSYQTTTGVICDYKIFIDKHNFTLNEEIENQDYTATILKLKSVQEQKRIERIEYQKELRKGENNCFIATMVYEDINHPKVEYLRQFRDNSLSSSFLGKTFIHYYYIFSPKLVIILNNKTIIKILIKSILDLFIKFNNKNNNY